MKLPRRFYKIKWWLEHQIIKNKLYGFRAVWDYEYYYLMSRRRKNLKKKLYIKKKCGAGWSARVPKLRIRLIKRDGAICFWCNRPLTRENATIDHIKPLSMGGAGRDIRNMRLIHDPCRVERDKLIQKGTLKLDYDEQIVSKTN